MDSGRIIGERQSPDGQEEPKSDSVSKSGVIGGEFKNKNNCPIVS